jgi:hypothetical protein
MRGHVNAWLGGFAFVLLAAATGLGQAPPWPEAALPLPFAEGGAFPASSAEPEAPSYFAGEGIEPTAPRFEMSFADTILDSLFGDVYAEGRWRPLTLRSFFTEGWNESWGSGPAGQSGLTPRHGWLGAFDGVFFRLWITTFTYTNNLNTSYHGNRYAGSYEIYLPFSRRFDLAMIVPFIVANGTPPPGHRYTSEFGDLTVTARFMLSETKATTQIFAVDVRTPTGTLATGNGVLSIAPGYQFWTNPGGAWVVRGGSNFSVPMNAPPNAAHTSYPGHTSYNGDLAIGRYFTPHDVPFGDLVLYAASNWSFPLDGTTKTNSYFGIGPGTRFHIGNNFFLLHYWEFPLIGPHPYTYFMQTALLKVF